MYVKKQFFAEITSRLASESPDILVEETGELLHVQYKNTPLCDIDFPSRVLYNPDNIIEREKRNAFDRVLAICEHTVAHLEGQEQSAAAPDLTMRE